MRRVLMVSPHFPPDSTAATHRVRLLAPHLSEHGWQPTVLTVDPRDYEGRLDLDLFASVPRDLRVERARAWPARISRLAGIGDLGLRSFHGLWRRAEELCAEARFDAVFVTIYPAYTALIGPLLKRRFHCAFVLDYQDPWVGEWGRSAGPGVDGRPDVKSRLSRFVATGLEPHALEAADAVTAVSRATYEQALERTPDARPRACAELPIGWDRRDLEFAADGAPAFEDDGLVHLAYVGTLLPTGLETLRAVLGAVAGVRASHPEARRLRLHFYGTSNQRVAGAPPRVLPVAAEYGLLDVATEETARLDYFTALRVLHDSTAVLLIGNRERHYTPSKVFPALTAQRPVVAVLHDASSASDLLRRVGRAPTIRLTTYDDAGAQSRLDAIRDQLTGLLACPRYDAGAVDVRLLEPASAPALAGQLARVLDRCMP
jgi:hypothetical protein